MYKRAFIKAAAEKAGISQKEMEAALNAVIETIEEVLAEGENVTLTGFGTWKTSERKARKGRNPATGEPIDIPARTVPTFKAGKTLKEAVNVPDEDTAKDESAKAPEPVPVA